MMKMIYIIGILAYTNAMYADICPTPTDPLVQNYVYYVNGVRNTRPVAYYSSLELADTIGDFPEYKYDLEYNPISEDYKTAIINTILLKDRETIDKILKAIVNPSSASPSWRQVIEEKTAEYLLADSINSSITESASRITKKLLEGKKVIMVSHSQGNLYANKVWQILNGNGYGQNIGIVGVATPAVDVEGLGGSITPKTYATLSNDYVVNLVRAIYPLTVLPSTHTLSTFYEPWNHRFVDTYLRFDETRAKIASDVYRLVNLLSKPVACTPDPPPPPPVPCNTTVSYNGGTNGTIQPVTLGSDAGRVRLEFEAYTIKDAIKIYPQGQPNNILNSTGMVSGLHILKFSWIQ